MNLELKDKTAWVTGGSSGLGAAICTGLLAEGATVCSLSRSRPEDSRIHHLAADLAEPADLPELWKMHKKGLSLPPDILVNCAGTWPTHCVVETSLEAWQRTLDVNLTSLFVLCREFVKAHCAVSTPGVILNITSQAAFGGATSGHADYAAAKAGVVNFTKSLAREAATHQIRVNALAPGMMETPMAAEALADRREKYLARIPLGRIAEPAEIADVAVFLCSERACYMTGATVDVSGGMIMH